MKLKCGEEHIHSIQSQTNLRFGEVQLLSNLPPLCGAQVFVFAEGTLQFADLL